MGDPEALRLSEERQAFLLKLSDAIRPMGDPARILAEACRLLGTRLCVSRVAYGEIDGDECTFIAEYVDGVASMAGRFRWTNLGGSRADEIRRGGMLVSNDTASGPRTAAEREALHAAAIGAHVSALLTKDGRLVGALAVHSRTAREWTQDEITLVQDVADRIWAALDQRKVEAGLRASEERLFFPLRLSDALRTLSDRSF